MSKIMKISIAVIAASILTIGTLFAVIINQGTHKAGDEGAAETAGGSNVENSNEEETHFDGIGKKVETVHYKFNKALGHGSYASLNQQDFNGLKDMVKPIESLLDETEDELIRKDLENALYYLQAAQSGQDTTELRTVHRILHDLDFHINGPTSDNIEWGYTYLGDGESIPK
ncbi:hypothetical protein N780_02395 [Pontibacillus chungwhensis BH030062]|uniref:Uncharacterized protein n=1 Tax=Pontibacillus chungwhensis BH030062 TaxID=1385513 RepID=A0A0A2UW42_9BACI|nr:hypothetical protein [Pontibacillus chungwhensis]KGP90953.1 hypothetical protein N780_02395 [Pontibacillus chungwhensis BH030062]